MTDPIFLVCTNGKRDACCALRGRALMTALAADHAERIWECTHLGGHRFAGNLVCLPDGIIYGRVSADDGPRLADAYLAGASTRRSFAADRPGPRRPRSPSRSCDCGPGSAGIDEVRLIGVDVERRASGSTLATRDGSRIAFELRAEPAEPPRPTSCRADELEEPVHWRVV